MPGRRDGVGLVEAAHVQRPRPGQDRGQPEERPPVMLFRARPRSCLRPVPRWRISGAWIPVLGPVPLFHESGPEAPRRPQLGHVLEEVEIPSPHGHVEDDLGGHLVGRIPPFQNLVDVSQGIEERKGDGLFGPGPVLAQVGGRDADGVEPGMWLMQYSMVSAMRRMEGLGERSRSPAPRTLSGCRSARSP